MARVRMAARATPLLTGWRRLQYAYGGRRLRGMLDRVQTYCLFIGHARSGHSIVGALLDAHPQIVVSDELDALRYVAAGFGRRQLLFGSVHVARRQAAEHRRKGGLGGRTYSYEVPGQWQGRSRELRVVGDSRAGWTTRRLAQDPGLLPRLERIMAPVELRFIHVIRNPYDNIATMMLRGQRTFDSALAQYAANCEAFGPLVERIGPQRVTRIRHEHLVRDPRETLASLCRFLGVEPGEEYLAAAAAILYSSPSRSRERVEWKPAQLARVGELIARHGFLDGYSFDD